jgi:hypothetical protein
MFLRWVLARLRKLAQNSWDLHPIYKSNFCGAGDGTKGLLGKYFATELHTPSREIDIFCVLGMEPRILCPCHTPQPVSMFELRYMYTLAFTLQNETSINFICIEKSQNPRESLQCTICIIAVVWD